jgi:N6-adenosine-specific RNA methylase IME4
MSIAGGIITKENCGSNKSQAHIPHGNFGVIYADMPWLYKMYSKKGEAKSPSSKYPCMTFEEMAALRDEILFSAGPNCVLIMWTTWAADDETDFLQQAMDLMKLYGFTRKTGGPWMKLTTHGKLGFGTGYIMRSTSELFIVGTLGNPKIKNKKTRNCILSGQVPALLKDFIISIAAKKRDHSRKPDEMYALIEALFDGPYLELFARNKRKGWCSWGNETEKFGEVA